MPYIIPLEDLTSKNPVSSIKADIRLTYPQSVIFNDTHKIKIAITGRQVGKTELIIFEALFTASTIPKSLVVVIYPTYRLGKRILWKRLKAAANRKLKNKANETELSLELPNESRIEIIGADNPDSMVGLAAHKLLMDEFTILPNDNAHTYAKAITARYNAPSVYLGTPRGYNWAYDFYMTGREPNDLIKSFQLTTAQGGLVSKEALAEARATLSKLAYDQEYDGSFDTLKGQVYQSFSIANLDDEEDSLYKLEEITNGQQEILVGMDFNLNPMSAVLAIKNKDICYVFDVIEIMSSNTDEMALEIRNRFSNRLIDISPDPSGASGRTSAGGKTDVSILEGYGFTISLPRKNKAPAIRDRVNNTNANLMSSDGRVRLIIHPRCKSLINSLRGLTYKEGTSVPDKTLTDSRGVGLDHIVDALGYLMWQHFNILANHALTIEGPRIY